jgi:hypothetical protein
LSQFTSGLTGGSHCCQDQDCDDSHGCFLHLGTAVRGLGSD